MGMDGGIKIVPMKEVRNKWEQVKKKLIEHTEDYIQSIIKRYNRAKSIPEDSRDSWDNNTINYSQKWIQEAESNLDQLNKELSLFDNDWEPYLKKAWAPNNREGLVLVGLEGSSHSENLSIPQSRIKTGNEFLLDQDFNHKTDVYHALTSLHELLEPFDKLGRTFLVKVNAGGYFPPHKDYPLITRKTIRIVAFLSKACDSDSFEWSQSGQKQDIIPGRAYYVDTMKTHRTHSWEDGSIHLVVNVPKTWENVLKLCSMTNK